MVSGEFSRIIVSVVQDCDKNSVSISFVKTTDGPKNQNLNELDQPFMYIQILKEILLTIDFEQEHINEFLTYCREKIAGNSAQLKNLDKIEKEYRRASLQTIQWTSPFKPFTVYRDQGLSQTDFNQLIKTKGGLVSFNKFLLISLDRAVSFAFTDSNQHNPDLISILFEITSNPSISSSPFANIENGRYYPREEEIL